MKNLKTKVGISLAALACFFTLSAAPVSAMMDPDGKVVNSGDHNVIKVVETVKKLYPNWYKTQDKKRITLYAYDDLLKVEISDEFSKEENKVIIRDFNLDRLDDNDTVSLGKEVSYYGHIFLKGKTAYFGELSEGLQVELRKLYNSIIEEAPGKLLEANKEYHQGAMQRMEKEKKEFETGILKIIKRD